MFCRRLCKSVRTTSVAASVGSLLARLMDGLLRISKRGMVMVALALMVATFMVYPSNYARPTGPRARLGRAPLVVLVWSWPFLVNYSAGANACQDLHATDDCVLTCDRSALERADVVVFHHQEIQANISSLPLGARPPNQKWVWVSLESPSNTKNLRQLNGLFNWTMTYREDSDIFIPYGCLISRRQRDHVSIPEKPRLSTWIISNYHKKSRRAQLHLNLSKYMPIDVYGKSVRKYLKKTLLLPTISRYAFYLAFENSVHKDYITEKLWRNAFMAGSVPVVLGPPRANYERFVPADSFIHINDFPTEEKLAKFLKALWQNRTRYEQYFSWRKRYTVKMHTDWTERFCTICTKFNSLPQSKIYHNLYDWFHE
ncbi:alpha-(1,3)-fucosyltransferase 7 [Rhinoraja longicauda]